MIKVFFCLLLFNSQYINGQALKWYNGSVVLKTDAVLQGRISFEPMLDILLFERDMGRPRSVYPAYKVQSLYFYDDSANINRRFVSVDGGKGPVTSYFFFEVVVYGEVNVLRKQRIEANCPSDALDYDYYCQFEKSLVPLRQFTKRVYPWLLKKAGVRMADFVLTQSVRAGAEVNAIRIVEFYNHLVKSEEAIAKQ